ncbi:MAG: DapH/DapD/GlmU-related protein [Pseudomonadota bacterium]
MTDTATNLPALNALGIGWGTRSAAGTLLDVWFPAPVLLSADQAAAAIPRLEALGAGPAGVSVAAAAVAALLDILPADASAEVAALCEQEQPLELVWLPTDEPIAGTAAAYLKLHLLSHCLRQPNTLNLEAIFAHLPNVAWTNEGPVALDELTARQRAARVAGRVLDVQAIDKFPKLTNYVAPPGVRIADSARVRLGAYLGTGSTVMHEGFVNFNAGAIGPNMIEGRISQGVVIGADTDLGGGSSTMGTLSGGGAIRITIGEQCLIGANAGTGIPLGDRCTVEAGLYLTAATPVTLVGDGEERTVKARELAGLSDLLFLRNGRNGRVECRANGRAITLNEALHAHN